VATEGASGAIGQPEVRLGLVPAGGGTQRLPRLVGLERALDLILSGRQLDGRRALRAGLLDEMVHPRVLDEAVRDWAARPKRPLDRRLRLAVGDLAELTPLGRRFMYQQARASVLRRTHGHYPAPFRALEAIAVGLEEGMAAGLEAEAQAFADLGSSRGAHYLIWLFLEGQRRKRGPTPWIKPPPREPVGGEFPLEGEPSKTPLSGRSRGAQRPLEKGPAALERLGVVGAGFMGAGIAEVAAAAGISVRMRDVSAEALGRGMGSVRLLVYGSRRFGRLEARQILQRVSGGLDYSGFGRVDMAIEAVFEDLELKRSVLVELERAVPPEAVIASNTSALPIGQIAQAASHPERVVGMHFFSPVHRMPLLEVVRGPASSDHAVQAAVELGIRMGKTPIVVGDAPGFYTSRVLGAMLNEATLLLEEGAAIEEVDAAARKRLEETGMDVSRLSRRAG